MTLFDTSEDNFDFRQVLEGNEGGCCRDWQWHFIKNKVAPQKNLVTLFDTSGQVDYRQVLEGNGGGCCRDW